MTTHSGFQIRQNKQNSSTKMNQILLNSLVRFCRTALWPKENTETPAKDE